MTMYDIVEILHRSSDKGQVRDFIGESDFFNTNILSYHEQALRIWRSVARHYAIEEQEHNIPYSFAETAKLYALDALCIATPLIDNEDDVIKLAEFFTVFYLIVHMFDDHVEHRDKFYSKFDFTSSSDIDTQRGAAPFSFSLISLSVLQNILSEINNLSANDRLEIMQSIHTALARQTRYFASERQNSMSLAEVLEIKQRQVAGQTLALFGDVVSRYMQLDEKKAAHLHEGLIYLGSLTQITDDIRDKSIDSALRNANIVNTAHKLGFTAGNKNLLTVYQDEVKNAKNHLLKIYQPEHVDTLLSLPFYPFMIDKSKLKEL